MKVLFIGNSFTFYNDIPKLFEKIATSSNKNVIVDSITKSAYTLEKLSNSSDEVGKKVDEKLNSSNDYDVIILQEQSVRPLSNYQKFISSAKSLQTKINNTQKNCQIYLYATWGYKSAADARKITIEEMEMQLREAYKNAAQEMGVKVCNVGEAFTNVYNCHRDVELYSPSDMKHPSYAGSFLSACVLAATICEIDPMKSTFNGVIEDDKEAIYKVDFAQVLKSEAYKVVFEE